MTGTDQERLLGFRRIRSPEFQTSGIVVVTTPQRVTKLKRPHTTIPLADVFPSGIARLLRNLTCL